MKEKVLIATLGVYGRGIYRKLKNDNKYEIIGFVEKNEDLVKTFFDEKPIFAYKDLNHIDFDKIIVGGVWENDIKKTLLEHDIKKEKILYKGDEKLDYYTDAREKLTIQALTNLQKILQEDNIECCIFASSLINLFRDKKISSASDVDVLLFGDSMLPFVYEKIKQSKLFTNFSISTNPCPRNNKFFKKNESMQTIITSHCDRTTSEPIVIDIYNLKKRNNYSFLGRDGYSFFYFPNTILENKNGNIRFFNYGKHRLPIPKNAEKILSFMYGEDWITPPTKNWTEEDYKNLIEEKDLDSLGL